MQPLLGRMEGRKELNKDQRKKEYKEKMKDGKQEESEEVGRKQRRATCREEAMEKDRGWISGNRSSRWSAWRSAVV